ncbi:unnamed protein product [Protopolystoma xenopodis]|uniref:Uncharacterized protein n=1 Tax=Protopolystoma xenopodis TaxID=117903 RepID=A0A448WIN3_9PLAT|nr:unnamed protein product [Protopolystoma xenopodis]
MTIEVGSRRLAPSPCTYQKWIRASLSSCLVGSRHKGASSSNAVWCEALVYFRLSVDKVCNQGSATLHCRPLDRKTIWVADANLC